MQRTLVLSAALAVALALPLRAADPSADTVVATVNGTSITLGQMIALRESLPAQYLELPDQTLFDGILDQLIQQVALSQAVEKDLTRADTLKLENQRLGFLANLALDRTATAAASDEAVQTLYDQKYGKAPPAKEYRAAHILVPTEDEAKAIKEQLDKGGDFAAIAKEKSTDTGSGAAGGELGWFGLGMMVKPFEDAVVALKPGETSGPVKSDFGWHIVRLEETRDAQPPKLEDVKAELVGDLQQQAVESYVTDLTKAAEVTKSVEGMDPAILKNTSLIGN
ncbi:MAG: peptidylprolyl isomerase [Pseudomonadota bacterium]